MNIKRQSLMLILALVGASPVAAQNSDDWQDWALGSRWTIGAGYFVPNLDTKVLITDPDGVLGTGISFEKNLGLDDSQGTALVGIDWRFFKRHSLTYRYFDLQRSATTTSSVSIGIGGEIIDIDLPIQSFFDITAHEIAYSYSLMFDQKKELSIGLGVSVQDLALGIQGTESSPDPGEIIDSRLATTAPLPTLNIGFNYAFTEKWLFQSRIGWLALELDLGTDEKFSGAILNANAGIVWKAFNNVGFFANYQLFDVDVDIVETDGVNFALDYDYSGPVLGINVNF